MTELIGEIARRPQPAFEALIQGGEEIAHVVARMKAQDIDGTGKEQRALIFRVATIALQEHAGPTLPGMRGQVLIDLATVGDIGGSRHFSGDRNCG